MSYTRSYSETITVSGSKTVSVPYPASERGGTTSTTVYYTEYVPVNVNINVDTDPFDASVDDCNTNVNLLTGSVVATEAAQVASIDKNADKVAETIITGFFGYIRSEISQQVAELTQNIEAHLMHLRELSQSCLSKKKQMEGDFLRISSRYFKIFDDLNKELYNRIYELDKPAFVFQKELDDHNIRTTGNDLVNTVAVSGRESGELQSKISVSFAKKRALDTLTKAKLFLWQQKKLNNSIQRCMLNENVAALHLLPVCFTETRNEKNQIDRDLFISEFLTAYQNNSLKTEIMEHFSENSNRWSRITPEHHANLKIFFNAEMNKKYQGADQHTVRLKDMIRKIADLDSINVLSIMNS